MSLDQIQETEQTIRVDIKELYQFNSEILNLKKAIADNLESIELKKVP